VKKIEKYAMEIPKEIRHAIRELGNDQRIAILIALHRHDTLSFIQLVKTLEIDKGILSYHLRKLIKSALVLHDYKYEFGNMKYSFYGITPLGQNIVEFLCQAQQSTPDTS